MCGPAMFPAGPRWPRVRVLQVLWALLAVLLASRRLCAIKDFEECTWQVVLNEFKRVGENGASDRFFEQELVDTVGNLFHMLVDSPIDPSEKYLGFPYYLKINYSCEQKHSEDLVRMGHLTGLKPVVLVTFQSPVNFYRWKIEQLQIQMEAAPFRSKESCMAEEVCSMSWYTPMPIKNGSVVMRVDVSSNGLGTFIPDERFQVNINGFLKRNQDNNIQFTVGDELFNLMPQYFVGISSRPLWHTVDQSPVLILGGIPNEKYVLMTDTSFKDFSLVELSIDSCWVGSFYCPQSGFTATIYDTVATESTLFIRQNQLVYYFTGTYTTLYERNRGSGSWVRVLASECIKKLCPVYFHSNGSEYIMALTTGKHEGFVHFGTIKDGQVSFEMLPRQWSVCEQMGVTTCSIIWSDYIAGEYTLLLLVESEYENASKRFQVASYNTASDDLELLYRIPEFIPEARGLEFLMILGTESYTNTVMAPKGISCNPYNHLIFIWGNFLLQSSNKKNFIYLADFPKELSIKYMTRSFRGAVAIVTETEEIWYLLEGSYRVYRLFPSKGWKVHISLQLMQQSSLYASNETMLTLFYEGSKLYQLVYLMNNQKGQLVKRLMPVEQLLMYQQHTSHYDLDRKGGYLMLSFTNFCPFSVMRLRNLPGPQRYTRQERYRARPPRVLERSGFHNENSLAIYQGLIYYLLWLHSVYDKPYADPVHDPTWRWWEKNKQDQDYYFFLASNWRSAGGVFIEMDSYEKIYNLKSAYELPERIFLDKGTEYSFAIFLSAQSHSFRTMAELGTVFQLHSQVDVGVVLADPGCIEASVKQEVLINRNAVLFSITLKDKKVCYDQGISGHHLMKSSMTVNVVGSSGLCFQETHEGARMQGNLMVPVFIGCPPGKRLAFDITYTLEYSRLKNKHYFDCVQVDPEMPCFLFRDIFYPFFLIQDLVTGDSGSFQGSYVLLVVGGGPTLDTLKDYNKDEIYRFNSPLDKTNSLIWTTRTKRTTKDSAFHIMSHESPGIEWLCLENAPCYDNVPQGIFAPEFFFKVLVSNRGVDTSTYCNYQLTFLLHIHGLPLSPKRALFILMVSVSVFVGLVIFYIAFCLLWPLVVKGCTMIRWKINDIIASESYYTYASISGMSSMQSLRRSRMGSMFSSRMTEDKAEPKEAVERQLMT
ncbi:PREDICTED: cation channel sperm-associated protein subunit gamma isoform X1 [Cercocebus atys]|uniref:Cation channel sperm associated auxiliary subunit gamma n=1 Tax=Cercocebus atys TaxID=9531 RepID=A0A2K5MPX2_CERAT|nr:PREDICTED: cation channel sperm-associated protein subunit gamma isoform X1 [Cercocebus atys]XP_011934286.1 PREDICTED: cation channel sperm-associated protein subunit gamma isoform X1 [Cercocebus atys]